MVLSPEMRALVAGKGGRRGIIPLDPEPELDPHDRAVIMVAGIIDRALTGPAIGAYELAERIVDEVEMMLIEPED